MYNKFIKGRGRFHWRECFLLLLKQVLFQAERRFLIKKLFSLLMILVLTLSMGSISFAADVPLEQSNARTTRSISYSPGNGLITIVASVGYTVETDGLFNSYIKPYGTNFRYNYNQSCTVNSINTSFQTEGVLCDTSGNQRSAPYVFPINIYQSNPVAGRVYQANASLPSGRKILYIGHIDYGVWLTINATINGSWSGRTYNMG